MANVSVSIEIPTPAEQVWKLIGGFDSLPEWFSIVLGSELNEGGRIRHLTLADGAVVIERLEVFDEKKKTYSYSIIQGPFPVIDYLATISVFEIDQLDMSRVEWSADFTPVNISDIEAETLFTGIYSDALQILRKKFKRK